MSTYDPAGQDGAPSCQPGALLVKAAWELAQKAHFPVVMAGVGEQDAVARILAGAHGLGFKTLNPSPSPLLDPPASSHPLTHRSGGRHRV